MESPLDFFRRNQKILLPVIGIGCMLAFAVLPGLLSLLTEKQQKQSERNPVLFRWQGGELRQRELQQELEDHQRLAYLYTRVNMQKVALSMPQSETSQQLLNAYYGMFEQQFRQMYPGPTNFESAANAKIFDQIGKELGIVVSDKQVDQFLHELCGQPQMGSDGKPTGAFQTIVPAASFDAIVQDIAKSDAGFTQDRLFSLLQRMFTRQEVEQIFSLENVFSAETPLARWESFRRIRQRASIQAIPVSVADFVGGVREPKSDELNAFFEANKNRLPDPNSAEMGLRTPARASFQLAFLNMDRLISSFKPRIDNKAISDYYEKNKDLRYTKAKLPTVDPSKPDDSKLLDPAAPQTPEAKPGETKPSESQPTESKPVAESGAKEAPKTEPATPEPAKTEPAKTEPAKTEPEPKKQSGLTREGFLPVNFQADPKPEPSKETPPAKDPADKSEPAKSEPTKTEPPKTEPAKTEPAIDAPAKKEPVEYIPLAEVEDKIRELLATEQATAQADLLMQKIEDEMFSYKKRRDRAIVKAEDASTLKFEEFDLAKTTAAIDPTIEAETLTLVSRDQFRKHPVSATQATFLQGAPLLSEVAFSEKAFPLYEPIRPRSLTGRYIIWKTEQRADEVPNLSDKAVNDQAVAAWKMVEARKAAEKQAQEYAETARKAIKAESNGKNQTLVELFNAKVLPIAPREIASFSWITLPTQQGERPTVSKVSGLDTPGNALMKEIFNLKQGQIGVAPNQPMSVYYVVQVTQADDLTKLRESFMQDVRTAEGWRQFAGANLDQQVSEARAFYERLRQRYKLEATGNQPFVVGNEQ